MSLLNKASLIQIPSGYKDGTLYSAKPTNGDGDFTFSRGSNLAATRVNSDGLIEKGRENLLLQSNQFDTTWSLTTSISITSGQSDKDGGTNAWLLKRADGSARFIKQTISQSGVQSFSVYIKAESTEWVYLFLGGTTSWAYFDLGSGSVGLTNSLIDSSIEAAGNGFYRCTITASASTSEVRIYPAQSNGSVSGDSDNGVYIQSAQLELGLISTPYIETGASTAQAGILEDMPRLDYSGGASCPSLLLEPQRTNAIIDSEYFSGGWTKFGGSTIEVGYQSPEGLNNAVKATRGSNRTLMRSNNYATLSVNNVFSIYAKSGSINKISLDIGDEGETEFDLTDEWQRFDIVVNPSTYRFCDISMPNSSLSGDYFYIYGAMLETSASYPTSYIPTYGASVTRGADASSDSNVTPTSNKATLFIEISGDDDSYSRNVCAFRNGTTNQYGLYFWGTDNNKFGFNSWQADSYGITNSTIFDGNIHKIAAVFDFTDFTTNTLFIDGVKQSISQVKGTTIQRTANKVSLIASQSNQNPRQNLHQFICFDSGLSDDECIQLTTI